MPSNVGYQEVTVKYFDPVDSDVANRIGVGVRKPGIYSGGYLTRISDTSVTMTALDCEIGDGTYQVRIQTGVGGSGTITVTGLSVASPYVVLKWTYTGSASVDYMEAVAETAANVLANTNWVIVGKCTFPGGTLTPGYGWDSTDKIITRTNPNVQDLFLKVEPTVAASMYVRVRGGRVSYGTANYDIGDQLSPLLVAPGSNSWIALIQVTAAGAISVSYGSAAASPTAPDYSGLITLAEITIASGTSSIVASNIKDVRDFVSAGATLNNLLPAQSGYSGYYFRTNGASTSWAPNYKTLIWYVDGTLANASTSVNQSATLRAPFAGVIVGAYAYVDTAPAATAIICDIHKNGTTIWATQGNRVQIAASATSGSQTSFDTTAVSNADYFKLYLDQIGTGTTGTNLTVHLVIRETV